MHFCFVGVCTFIVGTEIIYTASFISQNFYFTFKQKLTLWHFSLTGFQVELNIEIKINSILERWTLCWSKNVSLARKLTSSILTPARFECPDTFSGVASRALTLFSNCDPISPHFPSWFSPPSLWAFPQVSLRWKSTLFTRSTEQQTGETAFGTRLTPSINRPSRVCVYEITHTIVFTAR